MLETSVDLLNGLFLVAMIFLTTVCIIGSIVAALRAVNQGTSSSESIQRKFVDDMGSQSGGPLGPKAVVNKAAESHLEVPAPEDCKSYASRQTPAVGEFLIGTYRS